ncbi:unnamed protein product [Ambrosiozyma monospora]|uniref:Unnamed protein product n=1 Tax=Ambrosiozyma monospora TaxID=43982 RepID=A0ACB5T6J0_AMBMO|nr:unnamed protein product [Ambrosiozyma monospora]
MMSVTLEDDDEFWNLMTNKSYNYKYDKPNPHSLNLSKFIHLQQISTQIDETIQLVHTCGSNTNDRNPNYTTTWLYKSLKLIDYDQSIQIVGI